MDMQKKFYNNFNLNSKIISFLFISLPVFLITGPFLSDLAISIIALYGLFFIFLEKRIYLIKNLYVIFFFIFFLISLFSSLISEYIQLSLSASLFYFRFIFFSLGIYILIHKNDKILHFFFFLLTIAIVVLFIDMTFEYLFEFNILGNKSILHNRVGSFFSLKIFGSESIAGNYIIRIMPIGLILILDNKIMFKNKKNRNLLIFFYIFAPVYLCLISGERTPFILSLIYLFMIFIFFPIERNLKLISLLITLILSINLLIFSESSRERVVYGIYDSLNFESEKINIFSEIHQSHIDSSFMIISDNFPLGIGPKAFRQECKKKQYIINEHSCTTHPHNIYIQLLLETGLAGFVIIVLFYLYLMYGFFKNFYLFYKKKTSSLDYIYFLPLLLIFFPLMPSHQFYSNWWSIFIFLALGFLLTKLLPVKSEV